MAEWIWIPAGLAVAIGFFLALEGWTDLNNRIEDGTDPTEHDEWPI